MSDNGELKVYWKQNKQAGDGEIYSGHSMRVHVAGEENDYSSYTESDMAISVTKDGHLSIYNVEGEGSVFLYHDQLEHLKKALEIAMSKES